METGRRVYFVPKTEMAVAEDELQLRVGRRLRDRRLLLGLSQAAVGGVLGMTSAGYARIEGGKSRISVWQLATLCRTLQLPAEDVLELGEDISTPAAPQDEALDRQLGQLVVSFRKLDPPNRREVLRVARLLVRDAPASVSG